MRGETTDGSAVWQPPPPPPPLPPQVVQWDTGGLFYRYAMAYTDCPVQAAPVAPCPHITPAAPPRAA